MFTGIVEETGTIESIIRNGPSSKVRIKCRRVLEGSLQGDSIAVNGVCLTAVYLGNGYFDADISYETIERTSLKAAGPGCAVNLERALTLSSRIGGHLVQGHVDAVASVSSVTKKGASYTLKINYPEKLGKYIVEKGSVCLDGISLTVAAINGTSFEAAVIPHTFENTNLRFKNPGDMINLETDQIARYVEKLLKNETKEDKLLSLINGMKR